MNEIVKDMDGFYYIDEIGDYIGPFKTTEQAEIALCAYLKWVEHDHIPELRKMRDYYD